MLLEDQKNYQKIGKWWYYGYFVVNHQTINTAINIYRIGTAVDINQNNPCDIFFQPHFYCFFKIEWKQSDNFFTCLTI